MDTFIWIWALLGFFAFISVISLQDKVSKLERRIRALEDDKAAPARVNLSGKIAEYIGSQVKLDFYDDEDDDDVFAVAATKGGRVTICDCDDRWVLVRLSEPDKKKQEPKTQEKLLRIHSIKSITTVSETT